MATKKTSPRTVDKRSPHKKPAKAAASTTSARATVSGPARKDRAPSANGDLAADKMDAV